MVMTENGVTGLEARAHIDLSVFVFCVMSIFLLIPRQAGIEDGQEIPATAHLYPSQRRGDFILIFRVYATCTVHMYM